MSDTKRKPRRYQHGYKFGCIHPDPARVSLRFGDYLDPAVRLPAVPAEFGHENLVTGWGMLGNDTVGDCAIAGPMHAVMLWDAESKHKVDITTESTIAEYAKITGYNPDDPSTDQGADPTVVADHWQYDGLTDADGQQHHIGAWVSLTPGNLTELWLATYLLDGVGVCLNLPNQWMRAFDENKPWDVLSDPDVEGGHYVLGVCRRAGSLGVVTWGKVQPMTPAGYQQANVATLAYLSQEKLTNGIDLDGFNVDQLRADLRALPHAK